MRDLKDLVCSSIFWVDPIARKALIQNPNSSPIKTYLNLSESEKIDQALNLKGHIGNIMEGFRAHIRYILAVMKKDGF